MRSDGAQLRRVSTRQRAIGTRTARMEGAAGRQVAQQRRQAGNALHHPLALQRRQAVDQQLRVGVARRGDDLGDRRQLHQPAGVHHAEPVDELRHQPHVVADQHHRRAERLLHARERLHHLALHHHVERAGRLVGDDHLGAQADRDGDAGALLHAAGQLVRIHVRHRRRQPDLAEQVADLRAEVRLRQRHPVIGQRVGDLRRMRSTGLSEFIEPCGTSAMPASRSRRIASSVRADSFSPSSHTSPPSMRPGGRIRRRMASAMVDLPEPDSPASPNRSARRG